MCGCAEDLLGRLLLEGLVRGDDAEGCAAGGWQVFLFRYTVWIGVFSVVWIGVRFEPAVYVG